MSHITLCHWSGGQLEHLTTEAQIQSQGRPLGLVVEKVAGAGTGFTLSTLSSLLFMLPPVFHNHLLSSASAMDKDTK